jgi:hypothetical protein
MAKSSPNTIAVIALIIGLGLLLVITIQPASLVQCGNFPAEKDGWCAEDGTYYITAMDYYELGGGRYDENWDYGKEIVLIYINSSQYVGEPFITDTYVNGSLFQWEDGWSFEVNLSFPISEFYIGASIVVPIAYNNYAVMLAMMISSLVTLVNLTEAIILNMTVSCHERYVTVIQEMTPPMPWYNTTGVPEYIVNGYYYGVEYEIQTYLDVGFATTAYFQQQLVAECNTGIPLYQGMVMGVYSGGICQFCIGYNMKTMATSVTLQEV